MIHLAAIIPPLSKKIENDNGCQPSASVKGATQLQDKIVVRNDPLFVTGNYEESKIKCEEFLKNNADNVLVFRLGGVLPTFTHGRLWAFFLY